MHREEAAVCGRVRRTIINSREREKNALLFVIDKCEKSSRITVKSEWDAFIRNS